MSKKTLALVIGLIVLTVILVAVAMRTTQPKVVPPVEENEPEIAQEAKTKLYFEESPVNSANTATVKVIMDSQDNEITAVQLELAYDPKFLTLTSITPSATFSGGVPLINTVDKRNGRISYALGLSPEQLATAPKGTTEIATLVFTKIASASGSASTAVTFLPKSLVSARGINQSVLKETQPVVINLQ